MMQRTRQWVACAVLAGCATAVQADETADIERVRDATAKLIGLLVDQGVLTRSRADALLADVTQPAAAAPAESPPGKPAASSPVRVTYIPEFVRKELKDELRTEMVMQAAREGLFGAREVPEWVRGIAWEGDLRVRYQYDDFAEDNASAFSIVETNRSRALTLLNTTEDRQRLRVRARLGLNARMDEQWSGSVRLTTGSTSDPLSSNQTLGNTGNRFVAAFDRAFVRYQAGESWNAVFGRFGNPWFGTDLLWANDLGFDGAAVQWTPALTRNWQGFATVAAIPLQEVELSSRDKWLFGVQVGAGYRGESGGPRGKLGLALYEYRNTVGVVNEPGSSLNDFTAPQFAQKGNTYFNISTDPNRPLFALASAYRIVNLTGTLDIPLSQGRLLTFTADMARNLGFDRADVAVRVGEDVAPEVNAYLVRVSFGKPAIAQLGDWQAFALYKHVERDAVMDAFTDSDFRLGGTDAKGFAIGASVGLGRNTGLTVRYFSADSISGAPLTVDTLQMDVSARF